MINVVCVGAHPDDVELSMGGTVLRMVEAGHNVTLVDLSNGEPTPFGSVETRKKESDSAAKTLGVSRITMDLPNRFIEDTIESRKKLAGVFRQLKCEYIFTHFEFDSHPDHVVACRLTEAARFYSKLTNSDIPGEPFFPAKIFHYFPNHIKLSLEPSFCVDITGFTDKKKAALECYNSQFIRNGNGKVIEDTITSNRYFGLRINKTAAEPFYQRDTPDIMELAGLFSK
ncbi:MAG: PIG-L family deacetylase [Leptospira sp.]|nr:PIG-L family deacetylase [Leptospira sp.]